MNSRPLVLEHEVITGYGREYAGSVDAAAADRLAAGALLKEVLATPKPGLVDRANNGAHADMSCETFIASIQSMNGYFGSCFTVGALTRGMPEAEALKHLQAVGLAAQENMYRATGGVNTHKGAIFSLGLLCGAAGRLSPDTCANAKAICDTASALCGGLCERAFSRLAEKPFGELSKGERMYIKHGMTGARGEAEKGFPTVINISLPIYALLLERGVPENGALVETLLYLIAHTQDTNIVSRHDMDTAVAASRAAKRCLQQGGFLEDGGRTRLEALDREFICRNISPGGSADLLAVTDFLYNIQFL